MLYLSPRRRESRARPAGPGRRALCAVHSLPPDFLAAFAAPRAAGAARGLHGDRHSLALCAPRALLASRAHREPLAPPAAASGAQNPRCEAPGSQLWQSGRAGGGPGYADVRSGQLRHWTSALGSRRRVGAATVWPVPSHTIPGISLHALTLCLSVLCRKRCGNTPRSKRPWPA